MKYMNYLLAGWMFLNVHTTVAQERTGAVRERVNIDTGWCFSFGHPADVSKDFQHATGYFSYLAKASYGDGAAGTRFDDRSWRKLDLPHDWAVELPFDSNGSLSHGFKALGRNFPGNSIGWYRKHLFFSKADKGKRISIQFDGVFRQCSVWVNGFYLGTEPSGYSGMEYNISEYLNYNGENIIAVRVDATMEEGWFYEGAGIYRHVWLQKTNPLHVTTHGSYVNPVPVGQDALLQVSTNIINEQTRAAACRVQYHVLDAAGNTVADAAISDFTLAAWQQRDVTTVLKLTGVHRWSMDTPYLYTLVTEIRSGTEKRDSVQTVVGVRSLRFDPDKGFFLNDKPVKIKGTNNHQDHAGVGTAVPDALLGFRLRQLRQMGVNAYRTSHHPPAPELLDSCDHLGILVIDENRLMGVSAHHFEYMKRLIMRDRNHPSVISWSIGNEEWGIEGNELGADIARSMQAYVKTIDSTRGITAAISGGWQKGISNVIDIMGVNYVGQINTDQHHQEFPDQPMWGTEEGSTRATRGVYIKDDAGHLLPAYDARPYPNFITIEEGWKYYMARDYLAGMFIWTGFDYRGEPTPYGWPTVVSYHGMLDLCGFPKDVSWYLKSWWTKDTILHILPHWNWKGDEGKIKEVWVYSNCTEVELLLNGKSLGKKKMEPLGHLEWKVPYAPGKLQAIGYINGKRVAVTKQETTGEASLAVLSPDRSTIQADGKDLSVITVSVTDASGRLLPAAADGFTFDIEGPGRIIGVGNGNPVSREPERYIPSVFSVQPYLIKEKAVMDLRDEKKLSEPGLDDLAWEPAFRASRDSLFGRQANFVISRGYFLMPDTDSTTVVTYFSRNIGKEQSVYLNGVKVAAGMNRDTAIGLSRSLLRPGRNSFVIVAAPFLKVNPWDEVNTDPGRIRLYTPAGKWQRKLFNGYAQVLVQSTGQKGTIILSAVAKGLPVMKKEILAR
jgi:beta-galactosidase